MYTTIKAIAISFKPRKWDKIYNAKQMDTLFRKAAEQRPDLILATEGALEGYVVMDVVEGRKKQTEMLGIAEPIDGIYIEHFKKLAKELKTCLCFGFAEKIGQKVYNSAIFIDHKGAIRGKYHKTQLAEGTHKSWKFNSIGKNIRSFETPFGKAGFLICNDRWNPIIARTLVLDGAQYLLIPSFGSKSRAQDKEVLARARENGVPIVEANVGVNLIASKGEIVGYERGNNKITSSIIDIPAYSSKKNARQSETLYMQTQSIEMHRRYIETIKRIEGKPNLVAEASKGKVIHKRSQKNQQKMY